MKIEQYVIDEADSDYFTIHFCRQAIKIKFSRSKNK